eukprot:gene8742-9676_t
MSIAVFDKHGVSLPSIKEVELGREKPADMSGQHFLLICSEEQLKIFSLPTLRPKNKEKLTAIDGSRVRNISMIKVNAIKDDETVEYHSMACLSNLGDLSVYAVPSLRIHLKANAISRDDVCGIQSVLITRHGQGFYLKSHTEIQGFSLTVNDILKPTCILKPGDGEDDDDIASDRGISPISLRREEHESIFTYNASSNQADSNTVPPDLIPESEKARASPATVKNSSAVGEHSSCVVTTEEIVKTSTGCETIFVTETRTEKKVESIIMACSSSPYRKHQVYTGNIK